MTGPAGARVRDHLFENLDSLFVTLAALIAAQLRGALEARPAASLAVAGGRTPAALLARLSSEILAWDRVFVTLTDERWVSSDDPASNAAMLRKTLLVGAAAPARFIPLYTGAPTPDEALQSVSAALATLPRPFDIMVLGMGDDGHTASLFPGADNLEAA